MSHTYRYNEDESLNKKALKPKRHVNFHHQHEHVYPEYVVLPNEVSDTLLVHVMNRTSPNFIKLKKQDNYVYSIPLIEETHMERNLSYLSAHILSRHSLIKKNDKLVPTKAHKENGYFYIAHLGFGEGDYPKEIGNILFHHLNLPTTKIFTKHYEVMRSYNAGLLDEEETKVFSHKVVIIKDFAKLNLSQFTNITSEYVLPRGLSKVEGIGMTPLKAGWPADRTVILVPTTKIGLIVRITKEFYKALIDQKYDDFQSLADLPFENNARILSIVPMDDRVL